MLVTYHLLFVSHMWCQSHVMSVTCYLSFVSHMWSQSHVMSVSCDLSLSVTCDVSHMSFVSHYDWLKKLVFTYVCSSVIAPTSAHLLDTPCSSSPLTRTPAHTYRLPTRGSGSHSHLSDHSVCLPGDHTNELRHNILFFAILPYNNNNNNVFYSQNAENQHSKQI